MALLGGEATRYEAFRVLAAVRLDVALGLWMVGPSCTLTSNQLATSVSRSIRCALQPARIITSCAADDLLRLPYSDQSDTDGCVVDRAGSTAGASRPILGHRE